MARSSHHSARAAFNNLVLADKEAAQLVDSCSNLAVNINLPTLSGASNHDSGDVVELPAECGPCSSESEAAAALPAAESDNEGYLTDEPGPKFRRLSCEDPKSALKSSLRPELLGALEGLGTVFLPQNPAAVEDYCRGVIACEHTEDNFYVYNLAMVQRLHAAWKRMMPRVQPCYAVKCNPDRGLLAVLAALGAGFDCASEAEIAQVLALGVHPDRIVYAHPCKPPRQIRWSAAQGVNLTTFDTESELAKMAQFHPNSGLLLRIRADDPGARCQLGNKYGAEPGTVQRLLEAAAALGLRVRGVSFHVGSGAKNPAAFTAAIEAARHAFDAGRALGFDMDTLDLGGGFSGGAVDAAGEVDLGGVPDAINAALESHFPDDGKLRIIAEPGRYYAEAFATYACYINGWRARPAAEGADAGEAFDYYITDGLYGSMNCLVYDHAELAPMGLHSPLLPPSPVGEEGRHYPSTIFGPTCDGLDTVCRDVPMPRLRTGDWVLFPRFGAYTIAGAVNFNGFDVAGASIHYVYC